MFVTLLTSRYLFPNSSRNDLDVLRDRYLRERFETELPSLVNYISYIYRTLCTYVVVEALASVL